MGEGHPWVHQKGGCQLGHDEGEKALRPVNFGGRGLLHYVWRTFCHLPSTERNNTGMKNGMIAVTVLTVSAITLAVVAMGAGASNVDVESGAIRVQE